MPSTRGVGSNTLENLWILYRHTLKLEREGLLTGDIDPEVGHNILFVHVSLLLIEEECAGALQVRQFLFFVSDSGGFESLLWGWTFLLQWARRCFQWNNGIIEWSCSVIVLKVWCPFGWALKVHRQVRFGCIHGHRSKQGLEDKTSPRTSQSLNIQFLLLWSQEWAVCIFDRLAMVSTWWVTENSHCVEMLRQLLNSVDLVAHLLKFHVGFSPMRLLLIWWSCPFLLRQLSILVADNFFQVFVVVTD